MPAPPGSSRRLKVGFVLPTWVSPPDQLGWRQVLDLAKQAEAVGFDSLWATDHLLLESTNAELRRRAGGAVPPGAEVLPEGYIEVFSVLSALAAAVPGLELGTLVACTGYRNPALLAKIADAIDDISGGRFVLGLGAGDSEDEHRVFGFPYENRISRFEEALTIVRTLLREGKLDYEGKYYRVEGCELLPRGPRPQGPPILIGTLKPKPRMQRLVAQYADQWNAWLAYGISWPEAVAAERDLIDEACRKHGRDPDTLARTAGLRVLMPGSLYTPPPNERPLKGSPEAMAEALQGFAGEGITHLQVALSPGTLESVKGFGQVLRLLDGR
jgi:alkanesulfonate monooxygenase SsuD/methylene tetrahydromethanopterin reductase-like flavin-dependent oxidoreductase (luciferase family)